MTRMACTAVALIDLAELFQGKMAAGSTYLSSELLNDYLFNSPNFFYFVLE